MTSVGEVHPRHASLQKWGDDGPPAAWGQGQD